MLNNIPKIDFYLLPQGNENYFLFLCRLIEKAYLRKHQIYIHCANTHELQQLDGLLWTFHDTSFIPHQNSEQAISDDCPIILGTKIAPERHQDILINLQEGMPENLQQFQRVIEIVPNDETKKALARQRYAQYKDQGFMIETHQIKH